MFYGRRAAFGDRGPPMDAPEYLAVSSIFRDKMYLFFYLEKKMTLRKVNLSKTTVAELEL